MINLKTYQKWIIGVFILLIIFSIQPTQTSDKKESAGEWGKVTFGIVLAVAGVALMLVPGGFPFGIMMGVIGMTAVGGFSIVSGLVGAFTPDPTFPTWIWFVAGFILLIMVLKGGKNK